MFYNPYFNQTKEWSEFWLRANNDKNHQIIIFESNNLKAYVYQYPFCFKMYFWYLPRAVVLKNNFDLEADLKQELEKLITDINTKARQNNKIVFLKIDYDLSFLHRYIYDDKCRDPEGLLNDYPELKYQKATKKLQYQSTKIIDLKLLKPTDNICTFWQENTKWFNVNFDKRTRYGTRKALDSNWIYDTEKNIENFDAFYNLYLETSNRQGFTIHPKKYLKTLLFEPFSKLILLKQNNQIHAAWFGVIINKSIINLYGANSMISRELYGQYFLHLLAIYGAVKEQCLEYDLGGLEEGKGYNLFKQGYKGEVKNFSESYDIIYSPITYYTYNTYKRTKKYLKYFNTIK